MPYVIAARRWCGLWFNVAHFRLRPLWPVVLLASMLAGPVTVEAVTVSWNVDSDGFWDVPSNWSTGIVPQPGEDVVIDRPAANVTVTFRTGTVAVNSLTSAENFAITGGTLDLATSSTLSTLTMSAGTLGGAGNVAISGLFTWSGGSLSGGGSTDANGGIALSGNVISLRTGRTLNNAGTATWTGTGAFSNDTNVTFNNLSGATFAINTASDIFGGTINNAGTITKTSGGGDGITRISATLNNTNTINVNSGALELENGGAHTGSFVIAAAARLEFGGGTHTLSAPASISGGGTMHFAAGTTSVNGGTYNVTGATRCASGTHTFLGAASVTSVGTLEIVGGTLNFSSGELITTTAYTQSSGTLTGTDTLTVSGLLTWSGGTMSGQGTTNANGGLMLTNAGGVNLRDTRTVNNAGVATWSGAGSFSNDTGAVFNNPAERHVEHSKPRRLLRRNPEQRRHAHQDRRRRRRPDPHLGHDEQHRHRDGHQRNVGPGRWRHPYGELCRRRRCHAVHRLRHAHDECRRQHRRHGPDAVRGRHDEFQCRDLQHHRHHRVQRGHTHVPRRSDRHVDGHDRDQRRDSRSQQR